MLCLYKGDTNNFKVSAKKVFTSNSTEMYPTLPEVSANIPPFTGQMRTHKCGSSEENFTYQKICCLCFMKVLQLFVSVRQRARQCECVLLLQGTCSQCHCALRYWRENAMLARQITRRSFWALVASSCVNFPWCSREIWIARQMLPCLPPVSHADEMHK